MRSLKCSHCNSTLAKEENNRVLVRSGFGKRQIYHSFEKGGGTITCWFCHEVNVLKEEEHGSFKR
jgi:phage FluMu protein Com